MTLRRRLLGLTREVMASSRSPVAAVTGPVRERWRAFSVRDRQLLVLMAVTLLVATLWLLVIRPARDSVRYWEAELPRLRSQSAALTAVLGDGGSATSPPSPQPRDVQQALAQSLASAGLAEFGSLRAEGRNFVIEFKPTTDLATAMAWALQAPDALRLTVSALSLQRVEDGDRTRLTVTVSVPVPVPVPVNTPSS